MGRYFYTSLILILAVGDAHGHDYLDRLDSYCKTPQPTLINTFICGFFRAIVNVRLQMNQPPRAVLRSPVQISVRENLPIGTYVYKLQIRDPDGPHVPDVVLESGPLVPAGNVTETTTKGVFEVPLQLTQVLDRETRAEYRIPMTLFDGLSRFNSEILLKVEDVNEAPIFEKKFYHLTIPNTLNASREYSIQGFPFYNPDVESFAQIENCYLLSPDFKFIEEHFWLETTDGRCVFGVRTSLLDVTATTVYNMNITVRDITGLSATTKFQLTILVLVTSTTTTAPTTSTTSQTTATQPMTTSTATTETPTTVAIIIERAPKVTVNSKEDNIFFKPNHGNITLTCTADGRPEPRIEWRKDGTLVDSTNGTLVLQKPKFMEEGQYQCYATNIHGSSVSKVYHVRVYYIQEVSQQPAEITALEGDSLTLHCLTEPGPSLATDVIWQFKDEASLDFEDFVPNGIVVIAGGTGDLIHRAVKSSDFPPGRVFRCVRSVPRLNITVNSPNITVNFQPKVVVDSAPSLLQFTSQSRFPYLVGQPLTLSCVFGGRPLPVQSWSKKVETIEETLTGSYWNTRYHIAALQKDDSGVYTCSGANTHTTSRETMTVVVKEKPTFESGPKDVILSGGLATFECLVHGDPRPITRWLLNTQPLQMSDHPAVLENRVDDVGNRLMVQNVQANDTMVIGCEASNMFGTAYQEGRLIYRNI